MLVYYMSFFKMSAKVVNELEKYHRNFLWVGGMGKKDHLVKWEDACCPPSNLGVLVLGI